MSNAQKATKGRRQTKEVGKKKIKEDTARTPKTGPYRDKEKR